MTLSDPVADFLTRIRNSIGARHRYVDVNWSKMIESLTHILKEQGFIENFLVKKEQENRGTVRIFLKYSSARNPVIKGLKRMSKPGRRRYVSHKEIPHFFGGLGLPILSTSKGIMAGNDAQDRKIGGELLCLVW